MTADELLSCLTDRPCEVCKFHTDLGCSKWSCVFEGKTEEWVPCGKELPLYMQRVLVTFHNEQTGEDLIRISYCYMQIDGFFSDTPLGYKAVAWMPLPKPYEGGAE